MALSYAVFFAAYAITMVVGVFLAVVLAVGWKDISWRKALRSAKYNAVYIVIIALFPLFIQLQDILEAHFAGPGESTREIIYTHWIFSLSGGAIKILQDRLDYKIVVDFFSIVYAWLFTFLLYFAPVLLVSTDDRVNLRKYAIAMMFNYLILTPFYALFPVSVSGSDPNLGITPLLYVNPHWGKMVTSVDPLNNDFPSGHVSLAVTTLLIFAYAGREYKKVYYFLIFATISIVFAVLFLGVHWPADVFAGFLVAVFAVVAANSERVQMTIDRYVRAANDRLFRERTVSQPSQPQAPP
jgi:membrane-associated phospholipid phosphatase